MNKLVAVFAFSYIAKSGNKTNVYVLDGTPEQHQAYLNRVNREYQPENGYDDKDGKFPELKGNPCFYSTTYKGDIVEIVIPDDPEKRPRIDTDELERELETAKLIGESGRDVLKAYQKMLNKHRASVKSKNSISEEPVDEI